LQTHVLAARWIVPVSQPPINGGWIRYCGDVVVEVGKGRAPNGADDRGDVAILPGLVNAHTHLEFSDCRQPIGPRGIALHDWIGQVIAARRSTNPDMKQQAIELGLDESVSAGVRLIGEICTPPCEYPDRFNKNQRIELVTFAEVLGLSAERATERFTAAELHNEQSESAGWSPHAPYSIWWSTIEACVQQASQHNRPLAMHVAESPAERELLESGCGPFAETLRSIGVWQDGLFPWGEQPFLKLILQLSAARTLIIHGNDLRSHEIQRLAQHPQMSVVFCPRTHAFFGHERHPVLEMLQSGINVALGTDSRASNPDLDLWGEVQFLLRHRQDLEPETVLKMATQNGGAALGRRRLGHIEAGLAPGLKVVSTQARNVDELYASFAESVSDSPC
jgi:aminodeoxyfutalosine deaminase